MLCFRNFPIAKKVYGKERGGSNMIFFRKIFVSQCRKKFVARPFRESVIPGIEKSYASEGYVTIFRRNLLPHKPEHFVEEAFYAVSQKISESEKVFGEEGGESINNFLRKFFVSECRKMPKGNPLVFP